MIAANDLLAIGALRLAYDVQIAVPARLSIISFDNITFGQFTKSALTTVAVPGAEIGNVALASLSALTKKSGAAGEVHEIPTRLVVRQTTAVVG